MEDNAGTGAGAQDAEPAPAMICPECEEIAVNSPAADLVPWEAHGLETPQWSHRDGSALCPVIGPSGGYEPAQPQRYQVEPGADTARLDPPAAMQARQRPIGDFLWSADPAREQEHQADDGYVCRFPSRGDDGFDQVVSYAEELEARASDLPDPAAAELPDDGPKTQAVIDGINNGSIDPADLDVGFWAAKAAEPRGEAPQTADEAFARGWSPDGGHGLFALGQGVIIEDGPTEQQVNNWNIANDHAEDGADLDDDLDYEAE
jgi:hypothetical protein